MDEKIYSVRVIASADKKDLLCSLTPDSVQCASPFFNLVNFLLEVGSSFEDLDKCLNKKYSAPGLDGNTYLLIINLPKIAKMYLVSLCNVVLSI